MKIKTIVLVSLLSAGLGFFTAVQAHHSIAAEFDTSQEFDIKGTVTALEWHNPHIWVYLDVVNSAGEIEKWQCEIGSPNSLLRAGWRKEDLPVGIVLMGKANPARDGSNTCESRTLSTEDGKRIFSRQGPNG